MDGRSDVTAVLLGFFFMVFMGPLSFLVRRVSPFPSQVRARRSRARGPASLVMRIAVLDRSDVGHVQQLHGLRLLVVAAAVVPGRRRDAGVPCQPLDRGEVGAGA